MTPDTRAFLRDLVLLLGLPALALAGLIAWWKPWTYRRALIMETASETREFHARKAGVRRATWRGLPVAAPDGYVLIVEDSLLEVIERSPVDTGTGSFAGHLALLVTTPERHARFRAGADNCGLNEGRCWADSAGGHRLDCHLAAGTPEPPLWWTPLTTCEAAAAGVTIAVNAPAPQAHLLWSTVAGALADVPEMPMQLTPQSGRLSARLFSNPQVGLPLTLFFDLDLPVEPFAFEGERQATSIRLEFIRLPVRDWRQLPGQTFRFPRNPAPGYIDGSVYLGTAHLPVDATEIRFGQVEGDRVPVVIELLVDFVDGGRPELGRLPLTWRTTVTFDATALDQVFRAAREQGAEVPA